MNSPLKVQKDVAALYRKTSADFEYLTQVQNTIFTFQQDGEFFVLRCTPESHRSSEQVEAELEWVEHLKKSGLPVAAPLQAQNGLLANRVEMEGIRYTSAAFQKAPGEIGQQTYWTPATFRLWGNVMGRMHRAASTFQPSGKRRHDWTKHLPCDPREDEEEIVAQAKLRELVSKLNYLPRSESSFGLIHSDLHFWNFSMTGRDLTVFDFDNCEYHWFLADLGTVIFEAATCIHQTRPRQEFIASFLGEFLAGYRLAHDFGEELRCLPIFVKLREIQIFLILSRRWRGRELGPFQKKFFSTVRETVLQDKPFVEASTMSAVLNF
jgi:amicoumacin kinase